MFEKPKRKRGEKTWKLSLLLTVTIILAAALYPFSNLGISQPKAYATEAWTDPIMICSTAWYGIKPEWLEDEEIYLREAINYSTLDFDFVSLRGASTYGQCGFGESRAYFNELDITLLVSNEQYNSDGMLGDMVAPLIEIVEMSEFQYPIEPSVITFNFTITDEHLHRSWRIGYFEAQRAVAAGLRGADLWAIGQ